MVDRGIDQGPPPIIQDRPLGVARGLQERGGVGGIAQAPGSEC